MFTILDQAKPTLVNRITLLWSHDTDAGTLLAYNLSLQLSQRINDNETNNNVLENIRTLLLVICVTDTYLQDLSDKIYAKPFTRWCSLTLRG